jgi:hypothetical protein
MDGLALLCNLFADGPVTLRRLRAAGFGALAELERIELARLAECIHCSIPQARDFADEARKLARRLSEEPASLPEPAPAPPAPPSVVRPGPLLAAPPAAALELLRPGLLPGLDEALCARLAQHEVRTLQALGEFAGLALARRTGIPYSTLLELARQARRGARRPPAESEPPRAPARTTPAPELRAHELQPRPPLRSALPERELLRSDEFTLPPLEPESAGPFG